MNKPIAINRAIHVEPAKYGWVITEDAICDGDDKNVFGPSNISAANRAKLAAGEGKTFKMYDDDGVFYYQGRVVADADEEESEETLFGPLDDFGLPNAGAVIIKYRHAAAPAGAFRAI